MFISFVIIELIWFLISIFIILWIDYVRIQNVHWIVIICDKILNYFLDSFKMFFWFWEYFETSIKDLIIIALTIHLIISNFKESFAFMNQNIAKIIFTFNVWIFNLVEVIITKLLKFLHFKFNILLLLCFIMINIFIKFIVYFPMELYFELLE